MLAITTFINDDVEGSIAGEAPLSQQ